MVILEATEPPSLLALRHLFYFVVIIGQVAIAAQGYGRTRNPCPSIASPLS